MRFSDHRTSQHSTTPNARMPRQAAYFERRGFLTEELLAAHAVAVSVQLPRMVCGDRPDLHRPSVDEPRLP